MKRLIKSFILFGLIVCFIAPVFSATATVTYSKGKVEIDRGNGWVPLNVGDEVNESDILSTGFKSEARLNYNGSIISLAALTRIEFSELKTIGKKDIVDFNVSMGAVRSKVSRVDRDPPDYRARTSVAVASVRGTDFIAFANGKVVCYSGKVAVMPVFIAKNVPNKNIDAPKNEGEEKDDFEDAEILITANEEVKVSSKGGISKPVSEAKKHRKKSKHKIKTASEKEGDSFGESFDLPDINIHEKKFGSIEIEVKLPVETPEE